MPTCYNHEQEATYICLYSECTKKNDLKYVLCEQCLYQYHDDHMDHCISIQDLLKDTEQIKNEINKNLEFTEVRIATSLKMKKQLNEKFLKIDAIQIILEDVKESKKIGPSQISKLDKYAQRLTKVQEVQNQVKNLKIECSKFQQGILQCSCKDGEPISFLNVEQKIPLGERTLCIECQNKAQKKISIVQLEQIVKQAEEEEMYITELLKIKNDKLNLQQAFNASLQSLELLINYQSMYFNEALTSQNKSIKIILDQQQSRQQYQQIGEFLSSYLQDYKKNDKLDFVPLTQIVSQINKIQRAIKDLNDTVQSQEFSKQGNNYTLICDIYKNKEYQVTKTIVIKRNSQVREVLDIIKSVLNIKDAKNIKLKNEEVIKIKDCPIIQKIDDNGNYGKMSLHYQY